jgi:hypothetical protein
MLNTGSLSQSRGLCKVIGTNGKTASPYRISGGVLVKRVKPEHIFRARQAVGIDEDVWLRYRNDFQIVRFEWWDGCVYEIEASDFERIGFLHGDGITFAKTRFVHISDLRLVREKRQNPRQLALALGVAP